MITTTEEAGLAAEELARESEIYRSLLETGSILVRLLKNETNVGYVAGLAYEMHVVAQAHGFVAKGDKEGISGLSAVFFNLAEYSDMYENYYAKGYADYVQEFREGLKWCRDEYINPGATEGDKMLLTEYALPILGQMVKHPEDSPKLFIQLAQKLDELVGVNGLSVYAAGGELLYSLDRPQLATHHKLKDVILLAYALERPNMLNRSDAEDAWCDFMEAIREVAQGIV